MSDPVWLTLVNKMRLRSLEGSIEDKAVCETHTATLGKWGPDNEVES